MKRLLLVASMVSTTCFASGLYVELGIGSTFAGSSTNCISDYTEKTNTMGCSDNPLGSVAVGYEYKNFTVHVEHTSSLVEKDPGLNMISIKYRHYLFD
jgi:hypothetical protein